MGRASGPVLVEGGRLAAGGDRFVAQDHRVAPAGPGLDLLERERAGEGGFGSGAGLGVALLEELR